MKLWKSGSVLTALVLSSNVNAAIISVDWQTTGDNLITQDTASGLDWLDLTVTAHELDNTQHQYMYKMNNLAQQY